MKRARLWLPICATLWLSVFLNFHQLGAQSFWNDEGNSARLSERSMALIVEGTASDIHPPLYYLLLHGWRELLGDSEFGLRALSAFSVVGVVAVTMALALALTNRVRTDSAGSMRFPGYLAALVAGLLAAVNPALVYYAQEARMYALLALWAVLSTWFLVRLLRQPESLSPVAGTILVSVAGLYTHYIYPAVLLWQNLLVLAWVVMSRRFRFLLRWVVIMLITLILFAPWLPIFWRQVGGRPGESVPLVRLLT